MYWWTSTCCVFQEMPVHTKVWSSKTHISSLLVLHIVCMIYSRTAVVCRDLFHLVSFSSQHKMQAPDKPGGWRSRKTGNYDRVKEKWKVARKEILKEVWKREREKRCSEKGWMTGRFCHRQWYCGMSDNVSDATTRWSGRHLYLSEQMKSHILKVHSCVSIT